MSKILCFLFIVVSIFFILPNQISTVFAEDCTKFNIVGVTDPQQPIPENLPLINITFTGVSSGNYLLDFGRSGIAESLVNGKNASVAIDGSVTIPVNKDNGKLSKGAHNATLQTFDPKSAPYSICDIRYKVGFNENECSAGIRPVDPRANERFALDINNAPAGKYQVWLQNTNDKSDTTMLSPDLNIDDYGKGSIEVGPYNKSVKGKLSIKKSTGVHFCEIGLTIYPDSGQPPRPIPTPPPPSTVTTVNTSSQIVLCTPSGGEPNSGIPTAIGCIPTKPANFVRTLLTFAVSISGGIALLLMALGAFEMITSAGNPESLQAGKDRFTQAIIGLLFIVFSVLLLKVIGVDILGLGTFLGIP